LDAYVVSAILVHSIDGLKDAMVALAGSQAKSLAPANEPRLPFIERDKEIDFFAAKWRLLKPFPLGSFRKSCWRLIRRITLWGFQAYR